MPKITEYPEVTPEEVSELLPEYCVYPKEWVLGNFDGEPTCDIVEFLDKDLSAFDKIGAVFHLKFLYDKDLGLFASRCAEIVLPSFEEIEPKDSRPRDAIEATCGYHSGELSKEEFLLATEKAYEATREVKGSFNAKMSAAVTGDLIHTADHFGKWWERLISTEHFIVGHEQYEKEAEKKVLVLRRLLGQNV